MYLFENCKVCSLVCVEVRSNMPFWAVCDVIQPEVSPDV